MAGNWEGIAFVLIVTLFLGTFLYIFRMAESPSEKKKREAEKQSEMFKRLMQKGDELRKRKK